MRPIQFTENTRKGPKAFGLALTCEDREKINIQLNSLTFHCRVCVCVTELHRWSLLCRQGTCHFKGSGSCLKRKQVRRNWNRRKTETERRLIFYALSHPTKRLFKVEFVFIFFGTEGRAVEGDWPHQTWFSNAHFCISFPLTNSV